MERDGFRLLEKPNISPMHKKKLYLRIRVVVEKPPPKRKKSNLLALYACLLVKIKIYKNK